MKKIFKVFSIFVLVAAAIPTIAYLTGGHTGLYRHYKDGVSAGHLVHADKGGLYLKSYECELQLVDTPVFSRNSTNSVTSDDTPFGYWKFSTNDEVLGEQLKKAVGTNIKVEYTKWLVRPLRISTGNEAVSFEPLNK